MTPAKVKVERLLTLAADPGASEGEARTSAVLAAKIMKREGLEVCESRSGPRPKRAKRFRRRRYYGADTIFGLAARVRDVERYLKVR